MCDKGEIMNRNMKSFLVLVVLLVLIAGIGIVAAQSVNGKEKVKKQVPSTTQPPRLLYTRICCVEQVYWVDWYTGEDYLQVPISVEVWDKNLNPVKGIKVRVKVYNESDAQNYVDNPRFDQTKSTGANGIAKFGYFENYPAGPGGLSNPNWDSTPRIIQVWITNSDGRTTYMEKRFEIYAD